MSKTPKKPRTPKPPQPALRATDGDDPADALFDVEVPTGAEGASAPAVSGPQRRAHMLASGIVERIAKRAAADDEKGRPGRRRRPDGHDGRDGPEGSWAAEEDEGRIDLAFGDRVVARLRLDPGYVTAEIDPRAGAGDPVALRRLGMPHRDRTRSAAGWRTFTIKTKRDAARLVHALTGRPRREPDGDEGYGAPGFGAPRRTTGGRVRIASLLDRPRPDAGHRVLVDPIWPRGLSQEQAAELFDEWLPAISPSPPLRQAYGPTPGRLRNFRRAYYKELKGTSRATLASRLRKRARQETVTLLTAARDPDTSAAAALAEAITRPHTPRL